MGDLQRHNRVGVSRAVTSWRLCWHSNKAGHHHPNKRIVKGRRRRFEVGAKMIREFGDDAGIAEAKCCS